VSGDGDGGPGLTPEEASRHVIGHITAFARELRLEGADVPANAGIDATRAIQTIGLAERDQVKAALRATLISRPSDIKLFDRLFPDFWDRLLDEFEEPRERTQLEIMEQQALRGQEGDDLEAPGGGDGDSDTTVPGSSDDDDDDPDPDPEGTTDSPGGNPTNDREDEAGFAIEASTYSQVGSPKSIDVRGLEDEDSLTKAVDELTRAIGNLKGRRWKPTSGGNRIDARQALRKSFGSGGTVPDIPLQARKRSAVRAVILVDVSQSVLDTIDRGFLLRFLRSMYDVWRNVRIYFFDTDVRDVTETFAVPTTEQALVALQQAEAEWGGGTRIGNAFTIVREQHPYAIDRETSVFVISDGLEVDEIEQLKAEMAKISRRSNAIFWLNPLAASEGYEPTCRGMAAALPYVDGLFAFADESDIEEIARQLRLRGTGGSIGYEYDHRSRAQ
jgi:uncharacterized protein with von Willebrand factor type A (vWA) domain